MNGYKFPNGIVIANFHTGFFTLILQILGSEPYRGEGKTRVFLAQARVAVDNSCAITSVPSASSTCSPISE